MSYKTNLSKNKRAQLKSHMDDFTSFLWANHDMFEEFGAFIVGGRDALKFYNEHKNDDDKFDWWVTKRNADWEVVEDIVY
jgi:hypothetical protein